MKKNVLLQAITVLSIVTLGTTAFASEPPEGSTHPGFGKILKFPGPKPAATTTTLPTNVDFKTAPTLKKLRAFQRVNGDNLSSKIEELMDSRKWHVQAISYHTTPTTRRIEYRKYNKPTSHNFTGNVDAAMKLFRSSPYNTIEQLKGRMRREFLVGYHETKPILASARKDAVSQLRSLTLETDVHVETEDRAKSHKWSTLTFWLVRIDAERTTALVVTKYDHETLFPKVDGGQLERKETPVWQGWSAVNAEELKLLDQYLKIPKKN